MLRSSFATSLLLVLAGSAGASNFSVSGPGGPIPDPALVPGTWNASYTGTPLASTVNLPNAVTSITAVKLNGLAHTWRGDLHVVLKAPDGAAHNVIVRPGFTGSGFGDGGDYLAGDYTIVQSGGGLLNVGGTNLSGGTYNQFLNAGSGQWTNGIANTPLGSITGAAGVWTLEIRDWGPDDIGSLTGWTLEGTDVATDPISFCGAGDPNVTASCAGPAGSTGNGCANSGNGNGASLTASGSAAADTIVFTQSGELPFAFSIFIQGDMKLAAGVPFGDGIRCIGGPLRRLYLRNASAGVVSAPQPGDPSVKTMSAILGDPIAPGSTRYYQVYYRDALSVSGLNFNVGNALEITWP